MSSSKRAGREVLMISGEAGIPSLGTPGPLPYSGFIR